MDGRLRVGAVTYLNAKPLYHRLEEFAPRARLVMDYPSVLAERLGRGDLDLALIPSVEYLRGAAAGYQIVPGFAIAARGPVRSVKLFARVPFGQVKRLALDEGSRTSQVLAQIWLAEAHGVRPDAIESLPMGASALESTADAVLVIGDRAMKVPEGPFREVVDLGAAWLGLTGLPFVFALWVARPGVDLGRLPEALARCRADGLARAEELAAWHGPRLGLDHRICVEYLTRVLSYDLGDREVAGLRLFARKAAALGLAPGGVNLAFYSRRPDLAAHR